MPAPFTVLVADFLEETSVETPILQDIARIVMAGATDESGLGPYLPDADAIIVFHELPNVGE
jgi:C-terminal binding protein